MAGVLYKKEREVLEFLAQFQRQFGYSPTLGEIAKATGHRSNATVHALIRSLVEKGYVQKVEGNARVLKIIDNKIASSFTGTTSSIELPLMGFLTEGKPLEPHIDPNATFQISSSIISGKKTAYVLQVKGDSLSEDGILDKDFLVIEKTHEPLDGDIVLTIIDDTIAMIKKYFREDGKVILKSIKASRDPLSPDHLTIQGKLVSVVRKFI